MREDDLHHSLSVSSSILWLNKTDNIMTTGKGLLGVLAGLAAGTVIGMLLAPDKGDKVRKNISRKSEDLAEAINCKIDEKFEQLLKTISGKVKKATATDDAASNRDI
jgi:gas vesicle protein